MSERHLQIVETVVSTRRVSSREEIATWVAERRRELEELVEREGLGRQLTLDAEERAA